MPREEPSSSGNATRSGSWTWVAVVVAALVSVGLLVWGVHRSRRRQVALERKATERLNVGLPHVSAEPASKLAVLRETIHLTGTIRSAREVRVLPELGGKLERLSARRGRPVREGEVLAVIETDTLRAELDRAKAMLAVALAGVKQAAAQRDSARSDHRRLMELARSAAATDREREVSEARLSAAEAGLELAQARVEQARAAKRLVELRIEKATVRSPMTGVVADDYLRTPGEMVGPATPIAHIVDMVDLRAHARATEREFARLRSGQPAEIRVAPCGARAFGGELIVAGPAVDPLTRTAAVEIAVRNVQEGGGYLLKPGMFAEVTVTVAERRNVLAVKVESLSLRDGRETVLVARPAGAAGTPGSARASPTGAAGTPGSLSAAAQAGARASLTGAAGTVHVVEARHVEVGLRAGAWVEVTGGLEEGELVVTSGARLLAPGAEVHLVAEPAPDRRAGQ